MGFNRRKMEDQRREVAEKEAAVRRATDAQLLEDAERLITACNERPHDLFAHDRDRDYRLARGRDYRGRRPGRMFPPPSERTVYPLRYPKTLVQIGTSP
jgi:hypothetical protein